MSFQLDDTGGDLIFTLLIGGFASSNLDVAIENRVSLWQRFILREGEILGVAGVAGNGQSELLEALAGIRALSSGEILIEGKSIPAQKRNPHMERLLGVGHVPEDRHRMGLVMPFQACESAMAGTKGNLVDGDTSRKLARQVTVEVNDHRAKAHIAK